MKYVTGAIVGLLWGALLAWINSRINKMALEKNDTKALLSAQMARTAIDILGFAAVFLLRNVLPMSYEAVLIGTAAALGLLTVVFSYRLSRPEKKSEPPEQKKETEETEETEASHE